MSVQLTAFACGRCPQEFPSVDMRRSHRRTVHQMSCSVYEADGTRQRVTRLDSSTWGCPHPSCLSGFLRPDRLQAHYRLFHGNDRRHMEGERLGEDGFLLPAAARDCSAEEECRSSPRAQDGAEEECPSTPLAQDGAEEECQDGAEEECPSTTIGDDAREMPELMRRAHLCTVEYNDMTLLYCKSCDGMVDGSKAVSVSNHVNGHYRAVTGEQRTPARRRRRSWNRGRTWSRDQLDGLRAAVEGIQFTPLTDLKNRLFDDNPGGVVPPIPLLGVRDGFRCFTCPYYGVDARAMKNHTRKKHRDDPDGGAPIPCRVQTLLPGFGIRYFGVECTVEREADPNGTRWNAFMDKIAAIRETIRPSRDPPPRQLSPWLRKSKWSRYAAKLIPEDASFGSIKGAMEASDDSSDPYSRVADVLEAYGTVLQTQVLPEAEFKVRKAVAKDTVRGFIDFLASSTMKQYTAVIKAFVIALLRSACDGPGSSDLISTVVAPDYMKADLLALKRQLLDLPPGPLPESFDCLIVHKVLLGLWTPKHGRKMVVKRSKDCLFVQFMILYSIRPCNEGSHPAYCWTNVQEIAKMLSMLKFWCRATIEMEICKELWCPTATGMDVVDVQKLVGYLDESLALKETPFSYISMMQKLACSIAGDTKAKPQLMSSDGSSCNYLGYDINIRQIRSMIKALIQECNTIMRQEVLLGMNTHWIRRLLDGRTPILDAVNSNAHGYSFITDPKNPFLRHRNDLLRHMFHGDSSHYVSGYDAHGRIENLNVKALGSWMDACTRLEDLFGLLLHLTSSQPPRGQEYESFLIRNTATGDRAFFWIEGTLVMYQDYNKTDGNPRAKPKLVARFLPRCLRRLFLEYLALVRPVQVDVAAVLWDGEAAALYQDLWFVRQGRVGVPSNLSKVMRREFTKHCGAPFGLKAYRHLAAHFSGHIHAEVKALQAEPWAASAGHSRETEGRLYGQNMCDLRKIDRHLWREFKFVALKWQQYLHLAELETDSRQSTPPKIPGSTMYDVPADVTPASAASATPHVEIEFLPPAPKRKRLFHDCEGGHKALDPLELIDPAAMEWADAALGRSGYHAWKIPQQGVATAMALDNRRDFIAILPTGSGKSFVYMAPAEATQKTVVVIVPLLMLITDHLADCRARGISCDEFRVNKIDPTHPPLLVFVPVEIAITDGFQTWVKQLIAAGGLHSVFVDEVHLVLAAYRHKMTQLFLLSSLNCQMIGLTASLAPEEEVQVKSTLGRDFILVRSKTTRPNLQYGVHDVDDMDADIARRLRRWLATARAPEDRALVYCMTRKEVETLHGHLEEQGVPSSLLHARLETTEDKVRTLKSWELGTTLVMITTSVLGCGYNYPAVRLVLHRGSCFTLAGFHQESGRGGRDGKSTVCEVISSPAFRRSMENRLSKGDQGDRGVLSKFMQTNKWIEDNNVCRRFNLHRVLDGEAEVCVFFPGALRCDVCRRRQGTFAPPLGRWSQGSSLDMPLLEDLAPPEACVARPTCARRQMQRLKDLEDLHLVKRLGGDGSDCLLCHSNHLMHLCPKQRGRCLRCFDKGHAAAGCPIRKAMQSHVFHQCCHRCYFQLDAVGDEPVHKWVVDIQSVDGQASCNDLSGERIRILIWSVYRSEGSSKAGLKRLFPQMPFTDIDLEPWLVAKETDHVLNTFVRVAAAIMDMQNASDRI